MKGKSITQILMEQAKECGACIHYVAKWEETKIKFGIWQSTPCSYCFKLEKYVCALDACCKGEHFESRFNKEED